MTKVLQLADLLTGDVESKVQAAYPASLELRRLNKVNTELLEALKSSLSCLKEFGIGKQYTNAQAAIAKAEGGGA